VSPVAVHITVFPVAVHITVSPVAVHITMDECTLVFIDLWTANVQRQVSWRTCCDGLCISNPQFLAGELQERLLKQATAAQTTITCISVHTHYSLILSCKITPEKHKNACL
jgi:hypothetical protein